MTFRALAGACLVVAMLIAGCSFYARQQLDNNFGQPSPQDREVLSTSDAGVFYESEVKPIFESRCIACHACYDAPCQLKLSSNEGIDRGATKQSVYDGTRLFAAKPTRLFIDEEITSGWRHEGFFPVLNERSPAANLEGSLLYRHLRLKKENPLPDSDLLDQSQFDVTLYRQDSCPKIEEFDHYEKQKPLAGMPYGLPGLNDEEFNTLTAWLSQGAKFGAPKPISSALQDQVNTWETYLNQDSLKAQLISRYIFEHLFLGSIYFPDADPKPAERTWFRLVRSRTPPGQPIDIIATRRPTDAPGVKRPYYRLEPVQSARISKTLLPYRLDEERREWYNELFFNADFQVSQLPGYNSAEMNPFRSYAAIPTISRYKFLIGESEFFIGGFIKGPVCRGQVAVNVINDRFWVYFVAPENPFSPFMDGFVERQTEHLKLPGQDGSNAGILSYWTEYSKLHLDYIQAKADALNKLFAEGYKINTDLIWDGDGENDNVALTVFRNFDDAAVVKGLVGTPPKTAWVIDYPLLERIHYLLTTDYDVFGNIGHQLNTRLYMDFLRIEGENNFLAFLPESHRLKTRDYWYRNADSRLKKHLYGYDTYLSHNPDIDYETDNPQQELYTLLRDQVEKPLNQSYSRPLSETSALKKLLDLENITGEAATRLPEVTHIMITHEEETPQLVSLLANRGHSNITSLLSENETRLPSEDTITVAYGLIGDYPNVLLKIRDEDIQNFVDSVTRLRTEEDYFQLVSNFGIRRTDKNFWQFSDKLHEIFKQQQPYRYGWLDYNRLENR